MDGAQLCQRIICGALSQAEAGPQALYECSRDGYVGVLPCSHPDCRPYLSEMQARGMCTAAALEPERVFELLPLHPPVQPDEGGPPLPPVARMPSVVPPQRMPRFEPQTVQAPLENSYCQFMNWVAANQCLAAAGVIAAWWVLRRRD